MNDNPKGIDVTLMSCRESPHGSYISL